MELTIISPEALRQVADASYLDWVAANKTAALQYVQAINDLLEAAVIISKTHVENTITIPEDIIVEICEPETTYTESSSVNFGHPMAVEVTRYHLNKLNGVGEALFTLIKDAGYTVDVFAYNELTVYTQ